MLTCIACSKQLNAGSLSEQVDEDAAAATTRTAANTPCTKQTIRALTAQIKDMAVKASVVYKNCKPCLGSTEHDMSRTYMDTKAGSVSDRFPCAYSRTGNRNLSPRIWGKEMEARLKALSSGEDTPASISGRTESVASMEEEDEPKEWVAQVEPGVLITFVSLPQGGNDLKRIRFSREMYNKWQAQRWWAENYDKVMELYNVQRFNRHTVPLPVPPRNEYENLKTGSAEESPFTPPLGKEHPPRHFHRPTGNSSSDSLEHHHMHCHHHNDSCGLTSTPKLSNISAAKTEMSSLDASARTTSSREADYSGELSVSNASDLETEWVEQDDPGVYITIRALPGGTRELKRVRFSREVFGETQARLWWEQNRTRIQDEYL